ncbi:MAG: SIR2 family protein [Anaerolineae bacterium]|nr:SIR2 family protein [Phycisphaerae bacterium]
MPLEVLWRQSCSEERMDTVSRESFVADYTKALRNNSAAVFIGAGLSRASGFVDWRELLRDIATDLKLDVDHETDLIAVAQYHLNKHGSRNKLNQLIVDQFTKDVQLTDNHRLLATLPLDTVWTTNYDKLVEVAFNEAHKRTDVKIVQKNLATTRSGRVVTIYKMHGDVDHAHDAVLTKDDYETFASNRNLFSVKLKGDLVEKTFLFLGYSFNDPNIDYVLSRIRALLDQDSRQHYCIMRWPEKAKGSRGKKKADYDYARRKLELRVADLKRYGIQAVMIDRYDELTAILDELNHRIHLRDVFVSGSAHDFAPMGQERVEKLAYAIGRNLIQNGCNLVSGVGLGVGGNVVIGALESLLATGREDLSDRLTLRPFPQQPPSGMSRADFWTRYRQDMIRQSGACIFISGNKLDGGKVIEAKGVIEEFDIAHSLGKYPIPIGATGHAARQLWKYVSTDLPAFYPKGGVKKFFDILGDVSRSNEEIVRAVVGILKQIKAF